MGSLQSNGWIDRLLHRVRRMLSGRRRDGCTARKRHLQHGQNGRQKCWNMRASNDTSEHSIFTTNDTLKVHADDIHGRGSKEVLGQFKDS